MVDVGELNELNTVVSILVDNQRKNWRVAAFGNVGAPDALLFYLWGSNMCRLQDIEIYC